MNICVNVATSRENTHRYTSTTPDSTEYIFLFIFCDGWMLFGIFIDPYEECKAPNDANDTKYIEDGFPTAD